MSNTIQSYNPSHYLKRLLQLIFSSLLFWLAVYIIWQLVMLLMVISSYIPAYSLNVSWFIVGTFFALIVFICGLPCQLTWLFLTALHHPVNTDGNTVYVLIASLMNGLCFSIFEFAKSSSSLISTAIVVTLLSMICSLFGSYFILKIHEKLYANRS